MLSEVWYGEYMIEEFELGKRVVMDLFAEEAHGAVSVVLDFYRMIGVWSEDMDCFFCNPRDGSITARCELHGEGGE